MEKFLNFFDKYALKICVIFLLFFVPLYPKLPSVHITHTWVYIRLEDFVIAATALIWLIQFIKKKVSFHKEIGSAIGAYWLAGLFSLIFSIIFIGPYILNFFPSVAALSYLRRVEYMILFFVGFSAVKDLLDVRHYLKALSIATLFFSIYAFGQKFYIYLWEFFPAFFNKFPFCFPSFQTGNEEFAKGIPLCLPFEGRITSTFAGHYDLAAYLVLVIPIFIALIFVLKKRLHKVIFSAFTLSTIIVLILTASRISFPAYLIGSAVTLTLINRKKFIIPLFIISFLLLPLFSSSTIKRFIQTFRLTSVVVDSSGNVVGEALSPELQAMLDKNNGIMGNIPTQDLPEGTGFIGLPQVGEKTDVAVVRSTLTPEEAKRLKLENGGVELTTVKGNFTLRRALVYDISLTTRFQGEWPNAIRAFSKNVLLGSGFSTITLATDNDFLRFLGETGILGLLTFLFIFLLLFILFRRSFWKLKDPWIVSFAAGVAGGIIGLFINATMFDIFESSKVAETLWILIGVLVGAIAIQTNVKPNYKEEVKSILLSKLFIVIYLVIIAFAFFHNTIGNFFVADDFTWLRWAATFTPQDFLNAFTNASGFFFRPLDKLIMFFLYSVFAFNPTGYHFFNLTIHVLTGCGVFLLVNNISKNKLLSFVSAFIFLILPIHAENIFWISTISTNMSALFITYSLLFYIHFKHKKSYLPLALSVALFVLSLFSYEISLIFFGLILAIDLLLFKVDKKTIVNYVPFVIAAGIYIVIWRASGALGLNGDYAYSIPHLIPNFIGNFIGYVAAFIFGESALPYYIWTREFMKNQMLIALVSMGLLGVTAIFFLYRLKDKIFILLRNPDGKLFLFGFVFATVALLPFLGLGNISERYLYLASIGFSLSAAVLLNVISRKVSKRSIRIKKVYFFLIALILFGAFSMREIGHSNIEWKEAGRITNRTLSYLKVYEEKVPKNSNLFFVNTPIKYQDAWVFPVGLSDGVWFVYADDSLNVQNTSSVEKARELKSMSPNKSYIFIFKDREVSEIK